MALDKAYPEGVRRIDTGQSAEVQRSNMDAYDYEQQVLGVAIGVRLYSVSELVAEVEAMSVCGVGASDAVCVGSFDLLKVEVVAEYVGEPGASPSEIDLAVAREVFGEAANPRAVRDAETGMYHSDAYLLDGFPAGAPDCLVAEIERIL